MIIRTLITKKMMTNAINQLPAPENSRERFFMPVEGLPALPLP